ncbi:MAG: tRNA (adenosine(37)-N6)-dimethylallyltransferase MiaA [Patescibacteria group bacterium]|nr:tRNA (adenosine(37)-N6)-dimethylallyltransferase MiaA [Patescibacteria group bacterium]
MTALKPKLIVILGPNASGKTGLSIKLAKFIESKKLGYRGAEIISADSRQVYKGLDLGTGKITKKEMSGIPHHLLDIASPKRTLSVADYQKLGEKAVREILFRGKLPVICGGTGLYIDSLIYDFQLPEVAPDPALRKKLEKKTTEALFRDLQKIDPRRGAVIDSHNRRRLIRALEIIIKSGKPVPALQKRPAYNVLKIGLIRSKDDLRDRILKRLDERLSQGMIKEAKKLHDRGLSWKRMEELGLEYRYLSRYLRGRISLEEMKSELSREIVNYAKRQMTWFKKDKNIRWVKTEKEAERLLKRFLKNG